VKKGGFRKMKQNQSITNKITKSTATGRIHNTICMIALTCILALTGIFAGTKKVQAASDPDLKDTYKHVLRDKDENEVAKSGKYYFKWKKNKNYESVVYMSTNKKTGFKKTPITSSWEMLSNGKEAYYIKTGKNYSYICKYNFATKKVTKVKKLSLKNVIEWVLNAVCGDTVVLTKWDDTGDCYTSTIYLYDIGTKKLAEQEDAGYFEGSSGKYLFTAVDDNYGTGTTQRYTFWKVSSGKLKKIKSMECVNDFTIKDGKLYYATYIFKDKKSHVGQMNSKVSQANIYSCDLNGKNVKKLATTPKKSGKNNISIISVNDTYCVVDYNPEDVPARYKYIYSSRKLKKKK
jgi:hypothetical protein